MTQVFGGKREKKTRGRHLEGEERTDKRTGKWTKGKKTRDNWTKGKW